MAGGLNWTDIDSNSIVVPVIISILSLSLVIDFQLERKLARLHVMKFLTYCSKPVVIQGKRASNLLTSSITVSKIFSNFTWCPAVSCVGSTTFSWMAGNSCAGLKNACFHYHGVFANYFRFLVCNLTRGRNCYGIGNLIEPLISRRCGDKLSTSRVSEQSKWVCQRGYDFSFAFQWSPRLLWFALLPRWGPQLPWLWSAANLRVEDLCFDRWSRFTQQSRLTRGTFSL